MKQLKKLSWSLLVATVLLTSCRREESLTGNSRAENPLVTEAREFFENTITEGITRGTLNQERGWNPGEVTPQWEQAAFKQDDRYQYVFIPVYTQNQYMAREKILRDSIERVYHVPVSQLLCIRKGKDDLYEGVYLTLIPSKGYYSTNKNSVVEKYIKNPAFHGNFTGRVLYNDLVSFSILAVDKVVAGEYEWGFSRWTVPSKHSFWRNYRKMFRNIAVRATSQTRFIIDGGEIEEVETTYCTTCKISVDQWHTCPEAEPEENWEEDHDDWPTSEKDERDSWGNGNNNNNNNGNNSENNKNNSQKSKAERVVSNKNLNQTQWAKVVLWVNKMMTHCMAGKLLDAMEGKGVSIQFDSSINVAGSYNQSTNTITMRDFDGNGTTFLHELFHAYQQANGGFNMNVNGANVEVEAKLAGYMYDVWASPAARQSYMNDETGRYLYWMEKNLNSDYSIKKNRFYSVYHDYALLINQTNSKYGYDFSNMSIANLTGLSSGC